MRANIFILTLCYIILYSNNITASENNLRAPAYPLITVDPYLSLWSMTDTLYGDVTRHWTETRQSLIGALGVDGEVFRFLGKEELAHKIIVPTAEKEKWKAKYFFAEPDENWFALDFDDSKWNEGVAAFGTYNEPMTNTIWETEHIYVRREFELIEKNIKSELYIIYTHDDDLDLYLNGEKIISTGNKCSYGALHKIDKKLLNKYGKNIIAAHCYNRVGAAILDFGIVQEINNYQQFTKTAIQKSVELTATQTIYNFICGNIDLKLKFISPLLPNNLEILSLPINYISYQIKSNDEKDHEVQIYFEATPEFAVDAISQKIKVSKNKFKNITYLQTGTTEQNILGKKGDNRKIDWGYFYFASVENENSNFTIGDYQEVKKRFITSRNISDEMQNEIISRN